MFLPTLLILLDNPIMKILGFIYIFAMVRMNVTKILVEEYNLDVYDEDKLVIDAKIKEN